MKFLKNFEFNLIDDHVYDLTVIFTQLEGPSKLLVVFSFHSKEGEELESTGVPYSYSKEFQGFFKYVSAMTSGRKQTIELLNPPQKTDKMQVRVYSSAKNLSPVLVDLAICPTKLYARHIKYLSSKDDAVVGNFLDGLDQRFFKAENADFFWLMLNEYKSTHNSNLLELLISKIIKNLYKEKKIYSLRSLIIKNLSLIKFLDQLKIEKYISVKETKHPAPSCELLLFNRLKSITYHSISTDILVQIVNDKNKYKFPLSTVINKLSKNRFENLTSYSTEEIELHALMLAKVVRLFSDGNIRIKVDGECEYSIFLSYFFSKLEFLNVTDISLASAPPSTAQSGTMSTP